MEDKSQLYKNRIEGNQSDLKGVVYSFVDWIKFILKKWVIILIVSVIGAGIGLGYALTKKTIYNATLSFALEEDKGGGALNGALGIASQFGFDLGGSGAGAFAGENIIELMKSRYLIEKTLISRFEIKGRDTTLADLYIAVNELKKDWGNLTNLENISFNTKLERINYGITRDSILGLIYEKIKKENLTVFQKDKKFSIIDISVESRSETFSKYFAEKLADVTSDFYIETKSKKARANLEILERQTDSVRNELNIAITGVAKANDEVYNLNPSLNIKKVPSARRQVDVQANTAILTELVKNLELAKVTLQKETPLIQIIDKPILPLKKKKSSKLMALFFGAFLSGFTTVLFFSFKRWWENEMA